MWRKQKDFWDIKPEIKKIAFPARGKFCVSLQNGREIFIMEKLIIPFCHRHKLNSVCFFVGFLSGFIKTKSANFLLANSLGGMWGSNPRLFQTILTLLKFRFYRILYFVDLVLFGAVQTQIFCTNKSASVGRVHNYIIVHFFICINTYECSFVFCCVAFLVAIIIISFGKVIEDVI